MAATDSSEAKAFLNLIYPDDQPGYLTIFSQDKTTMFFPLTDRQKAAEYVAKVGQRQNVWYGVGLRESPLPNRQRGKEADITVVPGFYVEIDYSDPAHKRLDLPPTIEEARRLLDALPFPPSLVIHSGHGIQCYYLFHESFVIEDGADRTYIKDLLERFQQLIKTEAKRHGWHVDSTADLPRVLRVPGTLNLKSEPVPVRIIEEHPTARYAIEDFITYLPDREVEPSKSRPDGSLRANDNDFEPADINKIVAECAFMRHCRDDAAILSEPEWYASITILDRCEDGEKIAHDWSSAYPGYNYRETAKKILHARNDTSAYTCDKIMKDMGGQSYCLTCRHRGRIKTPITLGREDPSFTTALNNLASNNSVQDEPEVDGAIVQEQPAKPPRFSLITPDDLKQRPRPRWQLHDVLVEDSVAVLAGTHGTFKSFIAQDWALSTAAGIDWNGREVRQGPVVYISGEGSRGLAPRIQAWEIHRQTPASADCRFLTTAVQFLQPGDIADLLTAIRSQLSEKPVMIVVDTLARALVGGDENSSRDMGMFIAALDLLRTETGACVLVLHHFNKNGSTRGSSALPAGLDTEITVERQETDVRLLCGKQKDADHFDPISLSRVVVDLGDGDTSLVFDSADPTAKQLSALTLKVRDILPHYFGDTGATASEWKRTANDLGISDATFFRAKKELVEDLGQVYSDSDKKRGARFRVAEQRVYE